MPLPALIAAGGALLGGAIGADATSSASSKAREFQSEWNWRSYREAKRQFGVLQNKSIQNRVADARAAGIHPLYALGMSPAAPVGFQAGAAPEPASGSYLGEGISRASEAIAGGVGRHRAGKVAAANAQRLDVSVAGSSARDFAQAALFDSQRKTLEAKLNAEQDAVKLALEVAGVKPANTGRTALLDMYGRPYSIGSGSMAEHWEQEYGEAAGEIEGFPRYVRDNWRDAIKRWNEEKQRFLRQAYGTSKRLREKPRRKIPRRNLPHSSVRWRR